MFTFDSNYYTNNHGLGYDLGAAMYHHGLSLSSAPVKVVLELTGQNDGAEWHWIILLESGTYAYVTGGCDYTGWDCQSNAYVYEADTLEGALGLVDEANRFVFSEMLEKGETCRDTPSRW